MFGGRREVLNHDAFCVAVVGCIEEGVIFLEVGQVVSVPGLVECLGGAKGVIIDGVHSGSVGLMDGAAIVTPINEEIP